MEIDTIEIEFIDNGYVFRIHGRLKRYGEPIHKEQGDYCFKTLSEGVEFIKKEFGIE